MSSFLFLVTIYAVPTKCQVLEVHGLVLQLPALEEVSPSAKQMSNPATKIKNSMGYNRDMNNQPQEPEEGVIKMTN